MGIRGGSRADGPLDKYIDAVEATVLGGQGRSAERVRRDCRVMLMLCAFALGFAFACSVYVLMGWAL